MHNHCSEIWCWAQRVGEGGVSTVDTRNGEGVVCADNVVRAPVDSQVAIYCRWSRTRLWCPTTLVRSETARGSRGSLPMWTLLDARPVAALTELL